MGALWSDLRFAARSLRKAPGFTSVAVMTLALGIGANTAIFSVVYGVLLRPFAYRDAESLVVIAAEQEFGGRVRRANYSAPALETWLARAHAFDSIAMWGSTSMVLMGDAGARQVSAAYISDRFFATLDERLLLGRPIGPADARTPVAVISQRLWIREYGAKPDTIGRSIALNNQSYVIVGVARPEFQFPSERVDVWTPLGHAQALGTEAWINNPRGGGFNLVGRLRNGVSLAQAQSDADQVARTKDFRPIVSGLLESTTSGVRPALLMLFAAVGLVLVVACANVLNLLLARQTSRSHETWVRRALGASAGRLLSFSIAESSLIAIAGGAGGIGLATLGVRGFARIWPASLPRADAVRVDWPILVFALALSMAAALFGAIVPSNPRGRGYRVRSTLVVAQIAVSVVLLVGASLFGRSLVRLLHSDVGVTTDRVIVVEMNLAQGRALPPNRQIEMVNTVLNGVAAIPGIVDASVTTSLPLNGARLRYTLKEVDAGGGPRDYDIDALATTPAFFSTLGVRLVQGRFFTPADNSTSPPVMIMSAHTARRVFGDRDPIGRTLTLPAPGPRRSEEVALVGVVGNIKFEGLDAAPDGGIYRPFHQQPWPTNYLVARTVGDPLAFAPALRRQIAQADRQIVVGEIQTLEEGLTRSAAQPRFRTVLLVALAVLAVLLASIGLYGAVAYSVSLRSTELGIRLALGASPAVLLRMILAEGMTLALIGAALGVCGAFALARGVATLLYGIGPSDATSFIVAPAGLAMLAALASYLPARRAASVDPIVTLRHE